MPLCGVRSSGVLARFAAVATDTMTLTQLECLAALQRERDLDRAARECGLAPLAFADALVAIETAFGTRLLLLHGAFTDFTPDGSRIASWAVRMLAEWNVLHRDVQAMAPNRAAMAQRRRCSASRR